MVALSSCLLRFSNVGQEDEIIESMHLHAGRPMVIVGTPDSKRAGWANFLELSQIWSGDFTFSIHLVVGLSVSTDHFLNSIAVYSEGSNVVVAEPENRVMVRRSGQTVFASLTFGSRVLLTDSTNARVVCDIMYSTDDPEESGIDSDY